MDTTHLPVKVEPALSQRGWGGIFPWRQLLKTKESAAAFIFLVILAIGVILGPILSPYSVTGRRLPHALLPPLSVKDGSFYLLGTDAIGRDMLTRILAGGRLSLAIAVSVALISGVIGVSLGLVAGFYRGRVDDIIMRVVDVFMALPTIFFILVVLYAIGTSTINLVAVVAVARWMLYCRVTRGLVLALREEDFVAAARTLGASDVRIMLRHLAPSTLATVLTVGTIDVARIILLESSISFLGLGLQPPNVSWGLLVADGRDYMSRAWWLITFPGLFIFLTALSTNLFGLWLRMINDPLHAWRYRARRKSTVDPEGVHTT